jgi:hypothetical protein
LQLLAARMRQTAQKARGVPDTRLAEWASQLELALARLLEATQRAWAQGQPVQVLANAVPYMQAFGHVVLAWTWLEVALASAGDRAADTGRRQACQFFFHYELPKIDAWLSVVSRCDLTCAEMPDDAF